MTPYRELTKELVKEEVKERLSYDKELTESEILNDILEDTGNIFGNIDGSRTCSTYKAEQFLIDSEVFFDDEIRDLFNDISETYFAETLARGAEVLDVVILELLAPQVINEMLEEVERG